MFNKTRHSFSSRYDQAYLIVATMDVLIATLTLPMLLCTSRHGHGTEHDKQFKHSGCSTRACAPASTSLGLYKLICLFIYVANVVGVERMLSKYMYAYLVSPVVCMNKNKASHVMTSFWAAFGAGRLLCTFPMKLQVLNMHITFNNLLLIGFALAFYLVDSAHDGLWTLCVFLAFLTATIFPNVVCWANLNVQLSLSVITWLMLGSASGGAMYQYFTAFFFDKNGPVAMQQMCVFGAVTVTLSFMLNAKSLSTCGAPSTSGDVELELQLHQARDRKSRRQLITWNS